MNPSFNFNIRIKLRQIKIVKVNAKSMERQWLVYVCVYVCMCVCVYVCMCMLCVVTFLPLIIWRDTSFYDIVKERVKENKK
jgi:hypothetical protein